MVASVLFFSSENIIQFEVSSWTSELSSAYWECGNGAFFSFLLESLYLQTGKFLMDNLRIACSPFFRKRTET